MQYLKLLVIFSVLIFSGCAPDLPLKTENYVDADRFAGEWYVISNIPYFAERNKVASKTIYRKVGENQYQDIFESRDGGFDSEFDQLIGSVKSLNEQNTQWQSTFYWIIRFKFEVLDVDDDYQIILLGHRSRDYGWVMARNNQITDKDYAKAMAVFTENGYDISKFAKVPQLPSDIGQKGYQVVSN